MSNLKGKIVLVTGATRGVGKGIALGLGESGATIYITGRTLEPSSDRLRGSLAETQAAIEAVGGKCIAVPVDHNNDDEVQMLFNRIEQEQGKLDLLVNNVFAGVEAIKNAYGKPFWQQEPALWDAVNNVGLRSHYVASIYAGRLMSQTQQGVICTISSWGGLNYIFGAAYGANKSASDRLSADMAVELKPVGIASISIWPGIVGTEQIQDFAQQSNSPQGTWADGYNWETPLLTGRAIAALVNDPQVMNYTGKVQIVAELATKYNLVDEQGNRPVSLRSLRFILPATFPFLRNYASLIPDLKIPWVFLLWGMLKSPQI